MAAVPNGEAADVASMVAVVAEVDGDKVAVADVVEVVQKASVTRAAATASSDEAVAASNRGEVEVETAEVADATEVGRLVTRRTSSDTAAATADSSAAIIGTTTIGAVDDAEVEVV